MSLVVSTLGWMSHNQYWNYWYSRSRLFGQIPKGWYDYRKNCYYIFSNPERV